MITEIYIGTSQCDYKDELNVDYSISDIRNLTGRNIPKSLSIKLPMTATNKEIFKFVNEANVFTEITDTGEIYIDGSLYISGKVKVLDTVDYFKIMISHKGWIDNLTDVKIADLDWSSDDHAFTKSTMDDSEDPDSTSQFIHSTATKGDTFYTFGYGRFTPIYYYNNKTYHVWMQRETNGYDSRAMIWAYNHKTRIEGDNYDLKATGDVSGDTDVHPMPSVIVADDGHIVVAQEFVRIGDGNHNDAVTIKRSDYPEDETSWVNAKAKTAGWWTFIGKWQPDNSQRLAYPLLHKDTSGNLYAICRRYDGGGRYNTIFKSTDHGVTWDNGHDIVDSENGNIWIAPTAILNGTDDTLRYTFEKQVIGGDREKVFYVESSDGGVTWGDISGSFTKDTVASGAITMTELENGAYDFVVITKTDVSEDNIAAKTGTVNDTGNPYILTAEWTGGNIDFRMCYWDGSWQNSLIKNGTFNTNPVLIHKGGGIFDCYLEETANQLTVYRTTDLSTWAKIRDVKTTGGLTDNTFIINNYTNNYRDADYWMFVGVYGTHADYSDIFVEVKDNKNYLYPVTDYGEFEEVDANLVENMGTITACADYASFVAGKVKMVDVDHGLYTGDVIKIRGTTDYNGIFSITRIDDDNFYITETWNADRSGQWQRRARVRMEHRFPATKILGILENIFTYVGYVLTSTFKNSTAFKRLYIPYTKTRSLYTEEFKTDKEFRAGLSATDNNSQVVGGDPVASAAITVFGGSDNKIVPINDNDNEIKPYFDNGNDYNTGTYKYVIPADGSYNFVAAVRFTSARSEVGIYYSDNAGNAENPTCKVEIIGDAGTLATRNYYELTTNNHTHTFYIETGQIFLEATDSIYVKITISGFVDNTGIGGNLLLSISTTTTVFHNEIGNTYANGQSITYSDILPDMYCMDFIKGITQLQNLILFTDVLNKTIYMEERDSFYTSEVIDWSTKTDRHQKVSQKMISNGYQKIIRFKYKDDSNDEELVKWEEDNAESADSYLHTLSSEYVKPGEQLEENLIFAATIQMVQRDIGFITDTIPAIKGDNEQFLPKVIDYDYDSTNSGPTDMTGSERWEFEGDIRDTYPKFNTLDYEDLYDDYYFNDIELIDGGKIIVAYIVLDSNEYQKFITVVDDTTKEGFRPIYKIDIDDTVTYCRINRIVTNGKKTKVEFIKIKYQS